MQTWNKSMSGSYALHYRYEDEESQGHPPAPEYCYWYLLAGMMLRIDWHSNRPDEYVASFSSGRKETIVIGTFNTLSSAQKICKDAALADLACAIERVKDLKEDGE